MVREFVALIALAGVLTPLAIPAADPPWKIELENGEQFSANQVAEWHEPQSTPHIDGRRIFDAGNPIRSILSVRDESLDAPEAFVEFVGGDRLAGEVTGYRSGNTSPYEQLPPHLMVKTDDQVQPPDDASQSFVRVSQTWLQRVVWESRSTEYRPSTIILRNGGRLSFRGLRWTETGVSALMPDGIRQLEWLELAEIHLPKADGWKAYAEQLAILCPDLEARLIRCETSSGSRLTTSTRRFEARHWGDRNKSDSWLQLVQPAWSLDPLWLRFPGIHAWRFFAPTEPPLSLFEPHQTRRENVFAEGWRPRRDRNTQGTKLVSGNRWAVTGWGVHATTDLVYQLPPYVREFTASFGLDPAVGEHGCVEISILGNAPTPLFTRGPILGSKDVASTGWLTLNGDPHSPRTLTLRVDMAAQSRPTGADTFDIRDQGNWLEPTLKCDREGLKAAVLDSQKFSVPGLAGWSVSLPPGLTLDGRNVLDDSDSREPVFRRLIGAKSPYLVLSRNIDIGPKDRWLAIVLSRFEKSSAETQVQVRLAGRSAGEFQVPIRYGPIDPQPFVIPVPPNLGKSGLLEVIVYPPEKESWLDWRGYALLPERPGLRQLFEDDLTEWREASGSPPGLNLTRHQPFFGVAAMEVTAGLISCPQLPGWELPIVDAPRLGQYRYLAFAWRGEETPEMRLSLAHEGRIGSEIADALTPDARRRAKARNGRSRGLDDRGLKFGFTYHVGRKTKETAPAFPLDKKVPTDWKFEVRDVANEFGQLTLTGFALEVVETGRGFFDHLYLVRSPEDAEYLRQEIQRATEKPNNDPNNVRVAYRREDWGTAIADFAPLFATPDAPHGLWQRREHLGQSDAWTTRPQDPAKPFRLRTVVRLPEDRPQELDLRVSHQPQQDWDLVVVANGQEIFRKTINDSLTQPQRGWASVQVDLSAYRGQWLRLDVLNATNNGDGNESFWKRVALQDR